jgi:hypothetical protein
MPDLHLQSIASAALGAISCMHERSDLEYEIDARGMNVTSDNKYSVVWIE